MPRGDRRGPAGAGPMTGRGLGHCAGYPHPGYAVSAPPMRWASGGYGRGWRHRHVYHATGLPYWARGGYVPPAPNPAQEVETMKAYARDLREELEAIEAEIEEIEADDDE